MKSQYEVSLITTLKVWPSSENVDIKLEEEKAYQLSKLISEGYEIYSAIAFSTNDVSGIQYIVRRKVL